MTTRVFRRTGSKRSFISMQLSLSDEKAKTTRRALDVLKAEAAMSQVPQATFSWIVAEALIREANRSLTLKTLPLKEGQP